jgi:hypothetical protein
MLPLIFFLIKLCQLNYSIHTIGIPFHTHWKPGTPHARVRRNLSYFRPLLSSFYRDIDPPRLEFLEDMLQTWEQAPSIRTVGGI